jgi:hypothetical protein
LKIEELSCKQVWLRKQFPAIFGSFGISGNGRDSDKENRLVKQEL